MDLKDVKRVIQMVEEAQISHFSMEIEGTKIEVKKEWTGPSQTVHHHSIPMAMPSQPHAAHPTATPVAPAAPASTEQPKKDDKLIPIKSQMVGTFYSASKPDAPAYVKVGDAVTPGKVLCVIEAMKLFNEIECEISGTIEKICVENASPVEYGQELFLVRLP